MSDDYEARINVVVNDYLTTLDPEVQVFDFGYVPDTGNAHRDLAYTLILRERQYIEALRGLIGDAFSKTFAQLSPEEFTACAMIRAYEWQVEQRLYVKHASPNASEGQQAAQ